MKVKELIEILSEYNGEMPIILCDLTTDDDQDSSYGIEPRNIEKIKGQDYNEKPVDILLITFENKLNENPI